MADDNKGRKYEQIPRPAKRARVDAVLPDGFAQSSSSGRYSSAAPKLQSDFQNRVNMNNARSNRPVALQRPDFGTLSPKQAVRVLDTKLQHMPILRPPSASISKPIVSDSSHLVKFSALRPVFPLPDDGPSEPRASSSREGKTSSMLLNPPVINPRREISSMKPVPGPPLLPRSTKTGPPPSTPSKLRTISTTRVAIATDPRTENGSAELFSLLLQQRNPILIDSLEKELGRGLEQSPEKNKGGAAKGKYVRGGLAESFSRQFARSNTDQKLWEEHTARSFADGKRRMKSDMKLKILEILHRSPLPENTFHKSRSPLVTLAKCRVIDSEVNDFKHGKEVTMLFRHSILTKGVDHQLDNGVEIHVWRPYHELCSPSGDQAQIPDSVWLCSRFHVQHRSGDVNAAH